jgi:hypothetical protein
VNARPPSAPASGFTRTDLLVAVAVLATLAALFALPVTVIRRNSRLARCTANLQKISRAILDFAAGHNQSLPGLVPGQTGDLWWWYKEQVKQYAGLSGPSAPGGPVFSCPNDRGYSDPKPFHQNPRFDYNSYVFNGVTLPGIPSLAGWRLDAIGDPRRTLLVMEWTAHAPLSWHRSRTGTRNAPFYRDAPSVVGFVDGHVAEVPIYYDGFNAAYTRDPVAGYAYRYSGH